MIKTNEQHQAAVLTARQAAGYPSALQWWHSAPQAQREVLARYCEEFRPLLAAKAGGHR